MAKGYMFYDDETANSSQLICSLAYILCDNEGIQIAEPVNQLINPECKIASINQSIHHISNSDVAEMPTMLQFCENSEFIEHLSEYVLVAHNAKGADLHHIRKSFMACGKDIPEITYIDTMAISVNELQIGSLRKVCDYFDIELAHHHDALEDANACRNIFERLSKKYGTPEAVVWGAELSRNRSASTRPRVTGCLGYVNGSDRTIEDVLLEFESLGLKRTSQEVDRIGGHSFVVTGAVPGYVGDAIENTLKDAGARAGHTVLNSTEYVVLGDNAGRSKINAARENGKLVLSVFDLLALIGTDE